MVFFLKCMQMKCYGELAVIVVTNKKLLLNVWSTKQLTYKSAHNRLT